MTADEVEEYAWRSINQDDRGVPDYFINSITNNYNNIGIRYSLSVISEYRDFWKWLDL
jgi:hypothetical protein